MLTAAALFCPAGVDARRDLSRAELGTPALLNLAGRETLLAPHHVRGRRAGFMRR